MKAPFSAVCFDLDGVLIDTMPLHAQAWRQACKPFGLRALRQVIYEREGEPGVVTARLLCRAQQQAFSPRQLNQLLSDKERIFSRLARGVKVNARLLRLLKRLSRRGIRLALVTGTSSREVRRVVSNRALQLFEVIVTGDRVRHGKPHPEPYQRAFRQLGIQPCQAIVVENAPYGIRSALRARAGFVVALASSLPRRYLREANIVVSSVKRLCGLLEQVTVSD